RPAGVDERKERGAGDGKKRHRFGKAIDGGAPLLIQEKENRRNQRASVADTDPPDEIDNGESPADGDVNTPDSGALCKQPGHGHSQHHDYAEGQREAREPSKTKRTGQNDGRDFVRNRGVGMAGLENGRQAPDVRRIERRRLLGGAHAFSSSELRLRTAARYVVRGREFSSPRIL